MRNIIKILLLLNIIVLSSCATLVTKYGGKENFVVVNLEKSNLKFSASYFSIYKDSKGNIYAEFTSEYTHPAILVGEIKKDSSGDMIFYINTIKFATSWPNGFTEGESEASGAIKFHKEKDIFQVKVIEKIEFWDLKKGNIRFFDDYYVYEEGLEKVKNRMTRIKSIVEYLKTLKDQLPLVFGNAYFDTKDSYSFWAIVKPILFDKKRILPKELEELRKSETLLRDWEESYELIYMLYNFDYFFESILSNFKFVEKQK